MTQAPLEKASCQRQFLRVLVVEDRLPDAELALHALRADFEVSADVVHTPADFSERLHSKPYDIVLADYRLPNWTGIDALAMLRREGKDIPFILMSGTVGDETAVECIKKGATDYVLKDRLARLPVAVRQALEERALLEERKRAEEALRETTQTLQAIIKASPVAIIALDPSGIVKHWNPTAERIFGWNSKEVLGRFLPFVPEEKQAQSRALIEDVLRGEVVAGVEALQKRKDGSSLNVSISAAPLRDAEGKVIGIEALVADITERKQLEEQLRQSQKMEAIGQLAGGVAHDFNNLLTVIMGFNALVLEHLDSDNPSRERLTEVQKAGERAASLTRQLLAFSRRQVLQPQVLDLNAIVANTEKMLQRLIGEDVDLVTHLGPELGQVKADPGQIEQVILNLAVNARDAMPQGGKLTIETASVELDDAYAHSHVGVKRGPYVVLAVSDTGCGMDAETQKHIFEPFFTTKEKGTGLGLATVYGIVKQSDGHTCVYSEPGRGTTFKVYLPRLEEVSRAVEPNRVAAEVAHGSETILMVEDEEAVRALVRGVLKANGYTVLEASGPDDVSKILKRHQAPIHLMLTDVVMPQMSGRKLAEHLVSSHPEMKVLYMSGYADRTIAHHGVLEQGMAFLQKPFTPGALVRKVREVLEG